MSDDIQENNDRFDAVLKRMLTMKPMTAKQLSAKLKAERQAAKVQKTDNNR